LPCSDRGQSQSWNIQRRPFGDGTCIFTIRKIDTPAEFIHKTSGNHHVMVYGNYREELRKLNGLLGITTVEV